MEELTRTRTLSCPRDEKLSLKANEPIFGQRHEDAESKWETTALKICLDIPRETRKMSIGSNSEASDERLRSPTGNRRCSSSGGVSVKLATGHKRCDHQASCANFTTDDTFKTRRKHRLATWNVRGLQATGKLSILEKELTRSHIAIAGISETHYRGAGHFTSDNDNFICFSGNPNESVNGVGFWVARAHVGTILGYKCVSDRIITLRINAIPAPINIVQIYAPTSNSDDDTVESFYNDLESTLGYTPRLVKQ